MIQSALKIITKEYPLVSNPPFLYIKIYNNDSISNAITLNDIDCFRNVHIKDSFFAPVIKRK